MRVILFALVLALANGPRALAHNTDEQLTVQDLMEGVVKILVDQADIFGAARGGGHGSGFLVSVDPETGIGVLFTNRHVVESNDLAVQRVSIEFPTDQRRPEVIAGKVVFIDRIHDFAVLEVDLKQLKRARPRVLAVPTLDSPYFDFVQNERKLRGTKVVSIGHPLDGSNISSYGEISGLHIDPHDGPYIQTQTPSNPGNSGGPLIVEETGEVIGITSAGIPDADGVNFSLPIGVAVQQYLTWRAQVEEKVSPNLSEPRLIEVYVRPLSEGEAKSLNFHATLEQAIPGYWNDHEYVLTVATKEKGSKLQVDDVLLKLNGNVIGGHIYDLFNMAQNSPVESEFEVLRGGKVVLVKSKIPKMTYDYARRSLDYVYVSGLLIRQMNERGRMLTRPEMKSALQVMQIIQSPETQFAGHKYPPPGSVITAVKFGDREYRLRTLLDLKKALNENRGEKTVLIRALRSNVGRARDGSNFVIRSNMNDTTLLDGPEDIFVIPMREVLTPMQFSLHRFRKQFSFGDEAAETWNWREHVYAERMTTGCEQALFAKGIQPIAPKKK